MRSLAAPSVWLHKIAANSSGLVGLGKAGICSEHTDLGSLYRWSRLFGAEHVDGINANGSN